MRKGWLAVGLSALVGCTLVAGIDEFSDAVPSSGTAGAGGGAQSASATGAAAGTGGSAGGNSSSGGSPMGAYAALVMADDPIAYFRLGEPASATATVLPDADEILYHVGVARAELEQRLLSPA